MVVTLFAGSTGGPGGSLRWQLRGPRALSAPDAFRDAYRAALRPRLTALGQAIRQEAQAAYAGTRFAAGFTLATQTDPARIALRQGDPIFPYVEYKTDPHPITAKTAPYLHFYWARQGRWSRPRTVQHPGTKGKYRIAPIFAKYDPAFRAALTAAVQEAARA